MSTGSVAATFKKKMQQVGSSPRYFIFLGRSSLPNWILDKESMNKNVFIQGFTILYNK